MTAQNKLVLVDGSSYLYRAYHAMPDLRADPGNPDSPATGALRGMINMLQALRKEEPSAYAVCVFDASGPTFRDDIYPQYKANRAPMPDDLRAQIAPIHQVVLAMGWPMLAVPGVEADDVIATLASQAAAQGMQVLISSGDKDLAQLVTENIVIYDTMNGKRRDEAGVLAEFGVPPSLMIDYQTLVGDTVDNVPGVTKVGPKTAAKWLQEWGSLDNLLANADAIKGVAGQNLRDAREWLPTAAQLVTMKRDVADLPALADLAMREPNKPALAELYDQYGFKTLLRNLGETGAAQPLTITAQSSGNGDLFAIDTPTAAPVAASTAAGPATAAAAATPSIVRETGSGYQGFTGTVQYATILSWDDFDAALARWQQAELVAIDTETTSLDQMRAEIVGISVSTAPGEGAYIPLAHDYPGAPEQLPREEVLARLKPWLENAKHAKLGQHIKYDRHVFANHGIAVHGYLHDTMLESYVLEAHKPHGLESLAERHTGRQGTSYESLCGKGASQIPFSQVDIDTASHYACEDADQTFDVHQVLWPQLENNAALRGIYELEIASSEVLFRMEREGVLVDAPLLAQQSQALGTRIVELEEEAYALAGQPFNLSSPKQLAEIFFDKLGMPVVKKTATGARSTNEEVLEKLAEDYPLPARILEHRSLIKLKSTYTDKLGQLALPATGRVHTHYSQAVAITGRLSSTDPNLQNIPVRTAEGRRIREAFIAAPGKRIASADYSQIELRIMAHLSDDAALLNAFRNGEDIHKATASEVFNVALEEVSSEQRRYAKVINFGLIYGMGRFGLAKNLGITNSAAGTFIDRYFERYPGVRRYMDETKAQAKEQGYVETVFGRRLYLPEINSPNGPRRAGAERAAINAPMQGTAADLIKKAMVAVQALIDAENPRVQMIMQVHDELVFEVPEGDIDWVREHIPTAMAQVAELKVPLLAELGVGDNWEQAH
ncbi:DNA polymerase I [Lampropedia aestuarii]|uniref:DNA polymerase I n=1 Tax=Lampropedia aestuarii TaxID=2562762 RepID=UPI0024682C8E|nr:DNA polymerase I [Lampropedia aestuarii]MDH5857960.1 DNA polymerase I [Lampropedia aestuarii]